MRQAPIHRHGFYHSSRRISIALIIIFLITTPRMNESIRFPASNAVLWPKVHPYGSLPADPSPRRTLFGKQEDTTSQAPCQVYRNRAYERILLGIITISNGCNHYPPSAERILTCIQPSLQQSIKWQYSQVRCGDVACERFLVQRTGVMEYRPVIFCSPQ